MRFSRPFAGQIKSLVEVWLDESKCATEKRMRIVAKTDHWLVVSKNWGEHVHQPESQDRRVKPKSVLLIQLENRYGQKFYPIHRLDAATRGLVLFAKSSEAAGLLNLQMRENLIQKKYLALVRGFTADQGQIDLPLESDSTGVLLPSLTKYKTRDRLELPVAVGKRHPTSRYSLLEIELGTGRFHQIRRHFNRISHPVVGDREHGDSHHNRFFREVLKIPFLCLWACELSFQDPVSNAEIRLKDRPNRKWNRIFELMDKKDLGSFLAPQEQNQEPR